MSFCLFLIRKNSRFEKHYQAFYQLTLSIIDCTHLNHCTYVRTISPFLTLSFFFSAITPTTPTRNSRNSTMKIAYKSTSGHNLVISGSTQGFNLSRKLAKLSKEKKAAKTLGCVMGIFIICWLPFFVTNIVSGFCFQCLGSDPELVFQIVTWLGWLNSSMNPFIYAACSRDFSR